MSFPDPSIRRPIPTGVLISKPAKPKCEKPAGKIERGSRQLPWLTIAIGGSAAWVLLILVIAYCATSQNNVLQVGNRQMVVVNGNPAANPNGPDAFVPPEIDEFNGGAAVPKGDRKPQLARHLAARGEDVPPELKVFPEEFKPAPVAVPAKPPKNEVADVKPPPAPAPAPAAPPKDWRKDLDPGLFANCQQIGTDVLFHRDPPAAFKRARTEKKIVFVVHLSGNLEDKDFT